MIREIHSLFPVFVYCIWTVTFHRFFIMHLQFLKFSGFSYVRLKPTSNINTFLTLPDCLLKKIQKQGSKQRPIISMLNKILAKHFTVFNIFTDATATSLKPFSLPWIGNINIHVFLLNFLFLLFVFLLVYLFVCLFVCVVIMLLLSPIFCFYVFGIINISMTVIPTPLHQVDVARISTLEASSSKM